jgi:hypothetical protein
MNLRTFFRYSFFALAVTLGVTAALHAQHVYGRSSADSQLEFIGSVVLALLSGLGALFSLLFNQFVDASNREHEAHLKDRNTTLDNTQEMIASIVAGYANAHFQEVIEARLKGVGAAADSATKLLELEYQDDFRKRDRRDKILMDLSAALLKTTRAFRALTTFRLARDEPTESLVNVLAQALAAREQFLSAREDLFVLRAASPSHRQLLRDYASLLTDIIIDLRRSAADSSGFAPSSGEPKKETAYLDLMATYRDRLVSLDADIGRRLAVFLAPKLREAVRPVLPTTEHD